MCAWVGPHAPSFGRQLWGLPSRVEYLSSQEVFLPHVYGTTASLLWLELRGHSAWQATPLLDCVPARLSLLASMAPGDDCHGPGCSLAGIGPVALEYRSCHWPGGSPGSPQCVRPMGCWFFPVPRPPYVCAVSWATWLLFTGPPARCVALRLRCPGPLGSCSRMRPLGALLCLSVVLGHLAPVHLCARVVCCVASAVSWATRLLFTGVPARCVVLRVGCPGSLGSRSPLCPRGVLCCVCGVLGHVAPVHRSACSVCCFACAVSWATWLLFTSVPARCAVLRVRCPEPHGSCSPVCLLLLFLCSCGVPGHWAPVHRCTRSVFCFASALSSPTWLVFTSVPARCAALCVRCPGPLGCCSLVCQAVLSCPFAALGACACGLSWPTCRMFMGVRAVCGACVPLVVVSLLLPP